MANEWSPYLEDNPETFYNAVRPTGANTFSNYWQNKYSDVYGGYLGALGKQAIGGQSPSLTFGDYLKDYPFLKEWLSMSPGSRGQMGVGTSRWMV